MKPLILKARQFVTEIGDSLTRWMFAPGGVHTISLVASEGSATVTLRIDETTPAVLNASLAKLNQENAPQRAFIDKEHDQNAGATGWPTRFVWSETPQPGVYVELEASAFGQQLVAGKVIRAFSPSFHADVDLPNHIRAGQHLAIKAGKRGSKENPARMTGLVFPAIGTLTNDPAFRKILPLWAKNAGAPSGTVNTKQQQTDMKLTPEQKAALQARKSDLEQSLPALRASAAGNASDAAAAEAVQDAEQELQMTDTKLQLDAAAARNEELETALRAQRTKDADAGVADAIRRGAIAAKDTATQDTWKNKCIEDPANLVLLASMRGSPALDASRRLITPHVQISREDSVTVLRAFNAERDARKKGELYAREISERIGKGESLPLHAANALGTLAGEIVAQRTLELLTLEEPMLNMFSTDFSAENAALNQKITSRIVGIPGTSDYDADTGYANNDVTLTDVSVTISAHKSSQAVFGANDLAGTNRRLFDEVAPAQADAIGAAMMALAFAAITAANFAQKTTEAEVDFSRRSVITMGGALRDRGVRRNRFLLLRGNYYDKLFSDSAIVNLAGNQKAELITGDEMIPVHGFNVFRASTLPAGENLQGFGGGKSSIVVAGRVPSDYASALPGASGGGTSQVITNVKSGFSVHLVQFVDHKLGKAYSRMAFMLGAAKGQAAAGQRLVSA